MAGWPDDRPVWTGSCPCQPFSAAGKGAGFVDERHLWPAFFHLIRECRPAAVFGEQVASRDGLNWLDLVCADLEGAAYAVGAADLCAAGVGAPHIRQRLYWVAHANSSASRQGGADIRGRASGSDAQSRAGLGSSCLPDRLADSYGDGCTQGPEVRPVRAEHDDEHGSSVVRVADTDSRDTAEHARKRPRPGSEKGPRAPSEPEGCGSISAPRSADPLHGFWAGADWLGCRDGKLRPVEPGAFPLAHGIPARVAALRGYGNAIVPEVAAAFVRAAA
ncbi:DNA cytosine methyltransferase [Xanthomonas cannabis]|uniref:DNA cytosine methyltransferase n=1 Tax=Xanthomonas cannabis TaxID=1885674 RepID=UPI003CE5AF2B